MRTRRLASALSGDAGRHLQGRLCVPAHQRCFASASDQTGSVDWQEAAKFEADADLWWDTQRGPFAPLHAMNPTRCQFIRDAACSHFGKELSAAEPLAGLTAVDVGCGGGILVESLARLGSSVLGVDAVAKSVDIARAHAARDPLVASRAQYRACTAEQLVAEGQRFDLVTSLEVVEHVTDVATFTHVLSQLLRPGGMLVMSTLNRTLRSYALAIVAAEHLLQWVPQGTHSWRRFVTPEELTGTLLKHGLRPQRVAGMAYAPLSNTWALNGDLSTNYIGSWTFDRLDTPTR